jgi:hypothetical protein
MRKTVALASLLFSLATGPAVLGADKCEINCHECAAQCKQVLAYAKGKKGAQYAAVRKATEDCAQICQLAEDLKKRNSPLLSQANELCVAACQKCMEACKAANDKKLDACIASCKSCSECCK